MSKQNPEKNPQDALLAAVLDSTLDGVMAFSAVRDASGDIVDFLIALVNPSAQAIVNYTADHLLGRRMLEVFPGNLKDGLYEAYKKVTNTGEPFVTEHYYGHDGLDHWLRIRANQCGDGFAVTFSDITQSKLDEQELRKLSMVASRTEDGVVVADAQGRVEWINRAFTDITGYTFEELRGKVPGKVLQGPETDPTTVARIRDKLSRGEGFREVLLNYRKSGESYWIEVEVQPVHAPDGELTHFMAIERDITERIRGAQELAENQQRLLFALGASQTGLWDWDVMSGETYFSDTWYTMLGYEPGAFPMKIESWIQLAHPQDFKQAQAALQAYFKGETERYHCEMRVKNRAGQWQWILDVGEAVERDAAGQVTRMIGLHLDIQQQKAAQDELVQARDIAQQASAAKSAFVANMSHEIRTPMNAILGYADLMLDADQSPADQRNHAQTIRRNGRHLMDLLNDVLDISKIEAGKMSIERIACNPDQIFADVITLLMPKAIEKGIDLDFEAVGALPQRIMSDPTRMKQVLLNLVGNAIKFTSTGSVRVVVRTQPADDGSILLSCGVTDTGVGIEQNQLGRLFKPFNQADDSTTRRFGGTGLGLAISQNLCKLLGGSLDCISEHGAGSTFTASFKVGKAEQGLTKKRANSLPSSAGPEPLADRRVLVVEDGPDNQRLITHYLQRAGAQVTVAENGAVGRDAALDAVAAHQPFDVILMDMQMPVLDGYDATQALREQGYDRPIIAITAHAAASDRESCLAVGCNDYLSKPVDRHKLVQTIMGHLVSLADSGAGV